MFCFLQYWSGGGLWGQTSFFKGNTPTAAIGVCATSGVQPARVISKCHLACNSYIRTCKAISKKTRLISETMPVCLKAIACANTVVSSCLQTTL